MSIKTEILKNKRAEIKHWYEVFDSPEERTPETTQWLLMSAYKWLHSHYNILDDIINYIDTKMSVDSDHILNEKTGVTDVQDS